MVLWDWKLLGLVVLALFVAHGACLPHYCGKTPFSDVNIPPLNVRKNVTLKQVVMVMRHGDRTTFNWYPLDDGSFGRKQCWPRDTYIENCSLNYASKFDTDPRVSSMNIPRLYRKLFIPNANIERGNCMEGQLNMRGLQQQETNGQMLRRAYVNRVPFLPTKYSADAASQFYIYSDDIPRTVMSAEALFWGLYPPNSASNVADIVNIYTRDLARDIEFANPDVCPRVAQLEAEAYNSSNIKLYFQQIVMPLVQQLAGILGVNVSDLGKSQISELHDCTMAHVCHDAPLPPGYTLSLVAQLEKVKVFVETYLNSYPTAAQASRLRIGFLVGEILDWLKSAVDGKQNPKFVLYSAHDTTIMPLLTAYGLNSAVAEWAAYASTIIFELYEVQGQGHAIRMIYDQQEQILPQCGDVLCPWTTFYHVSDALVPKDVRRECALVKNAKT